MTATLNQIIEQARTLSPAERAQLIDTLNRESQAETFYEESAQSDASGLSPESDASEMSVAERIKLIKSVRGKYAHLPGSVDDFLREKHLDTEYQNQREERLRKEGRRT